jgi:hypothetical protein
MWNEIPIVKNDENHDKFLNMKKKYWKNFNAS